MLLLPRKSSFLRNQVDATLRLIACEEALTRPFCNKLVQFEKESIGQGATAVNANTRGALF